jgi:hypothetical protein
MGEKKLKLKSERDKQIAFLNASIKRCFAHKEDLSELYLHSECN